MAEGQNRNASAPCVLLTGYGSEGGYGVVRSLRASHPNARLIGMDTNPMVPHRALVDLHLTPPRRSSSAFIPFVHDTIVRESVDVCWPLPTEELVPFAVAKRELEDETGARVAIGTVESVRTANDKALLYAALDAAGLDLTCRWTRETDVAGLAQAVRAFGYPTGRVVIKPTVGAGAQGMRVLDAKIARYDALLGRLQLQTHARWPDVRRALQEAPAMPPMIVMEYMPGEEWDVDVLAEHGEVLVAVPRRNGRMFGGMALETSVLPNAPLVRHAADVVRALGLHLIHSLTFRADATGRWRILEINPRVPGSIIAATRAGVNLPGLMLDLVREQSRFAPWPAPEQVTLVRFWDDVVLADGVA